MSRFYGIQQESLAGTPAYDVWNRFKIGAFSNGEAPAPGLTQTSEGTWVRYPERRRVDASASKSTKQTKSLERFQHLNAAKAEAEAEVRQKTIAVGEAARLLAQVRARVLQSEREQAAQDQVRAKRAAAAIQGEVSPRRSAAAQAEYRAEGVRLRKLEAEIKKEIGR